MDFMDIRRNLWGGGVFSFSLRESKAEEFLSFYVGDNIIPNGLTTGCPFDSANVIDNGRIYVSGSLSLTLSFVLLIVGYNN